MHINQLQNKPYQFTLKFMVDGKLYKTEVKDAVASITVPAASATSNVKADPDINLLATIDLTNKL